jgi:hypothetical protein
LKKKSTKKKAGKPRRESWCIIATAGTNPHLSRQTAIAIAIQNFERGSSIFPAHFRALHSATSVQIIQQIDELVAIDRVGTISIKSEVRNGN